MGVWSRRYDIAAYGVYLDGGRVVMYGSGLRSAAGAFIMLESPFRTLPEWNARRGCSRWTGE
jgi:hypothetical protein